MYTFKRHRLCWLGGLFVFADVCDVLAPSFVWSPSHPQNDSEADIKMRRLRLREVDFLQVTWLLGGEAGIWCQVCVSSNRGLFHWEWHTSSQVAGFLCLYPLSGGSPPQWVDLVVKKTGGKGMFGSGGKRMVGSGGKRMVGLGQTQLCQWTSCSKCLSYHRWLLFSKDGFLKKK